MEKTQKYLSLDESISLQLTPKQIYRCCFHNGDTFCVTRADDGLHPNGEEVEEICIVESGNGLCRLFYNEYFQEEPVKQLVCQFVIELRIGDISIWSIYHNNDALLHHHYHSKLAEEDFLRGCALLGEKVTYRPVHHKVQISA